MERQIYTPPEGPKGSPPSAAILAAIGEEGVRRLLGLFYEELEQSSIRQMFPADMAASSQKSADFFIQMMGGPPLFSQKHGPPRMRARHFPFEIDEEARQVWLACFKKAMERFRFPPEHYQEFWEFLVDFSAWMVNSSGKTNL